MKKHLFNDLGFAGTFVGLVAMLLLPFLHYSATPMAMATATPNNEWRVAYIDASRDRVIDNGYEFYKFSADGSGAVRVDVLGTSGGVVGTIELDTDGETWLQIDTVLGIETSSIRIDVAGGVMILTVDGHQAAAWIDEQSGAVQSTPFPEFEPSDALMLLHLVASDMLDSESTVQRINSVSAQVRHGAVRHYVRCIAECLLLVAPAAITPAGQACMQSINCCMVFVSPWNPCCIIAAACILAAGGALALCLYNNC